MAENFRSFFSGTMGVMLGIGCGMVLLLGFLAGGCTLLVGSCATLANRESDKARKHLEEKENHAAEKEEPPAKTEAKKTAPPKVVVIEKPVYIPEPAAQPPFTGRFGQPEREPKPEKKTPAAPSLTARRTWTIDGETVEGEYRGVVKSQVRIRTLDGKLLSVAPSQLSPEDRALIFGEAKKTGK